MTTFEQQISERNRQIKLLMRLFNKSYASAAQLYYIIWNYKA